jgi:2,4-dienoyl-CoA reductase (NADPH2)
MQQGTMMTAGMGTPYPDAGPNAAIFQPLEFSSGLKIKNRLFRSNVSGQFDEYNGQGGYARINWEESFAAGGVGAIISSFTPVMVGGRIMIRYAMIDDDDKIPFWRLVGERVHAHDCRYLLQLSHSGRQQDNGGVENRMRRALSSTDRPDYFHGILCRSATESQIREIIGAFAAGARRAREAGLDGVELHGANGYLITQFLSRGINDRRDRWGGSLENRARFLLEIVKAIRAEVGPGFHLQLKINAADYNNALFPWRKRGNRIEETIPICKWAVEAGVNALHISSGSIFPHPRNPPGDFPLRDVIAYYDSLMNAGTRVRVNYKIFTTPVLGPLFRWWWNHRRGLAFDQISSGINLEAASTIKRAISGVPVIVTGGFQDASVIRGAIEQGRVDAVSIARPLIANRDLPRLFEQGLDWSDLPRIEQEGGAWPLRNKHRCSYCNRCLLNDLESPLGCYDRNRYDSYEQMIAEVMQVYQPNPWGIPERFGLAATNGKGPSGATPGGTAEPEIRGLGEVDRG